MSRLPRNLLGGLAALGLACFGLGLLTGWILRAPPAPGPSHLEQLTDDLGLRPDQVAAVDAILAGVDFDLDALIAEHREAMRGPVSRRLEESEQAILAVLDEAQRARYEELVVREGR